MPTAAANSKKPLSKSPLRLMPSVRRNAEAFSEKEGVTLNQFINIAVAEKLAHMEHEEWLQNRSKPTPKSLARALSLLDKPGSLAPEPGDELPPGYRSVREHRA